MVVKIRLSRFGKSHQPVYNIVVAQARTARDSRPLEVLGTYDPKPRMPLSSNTPSPVASSPVSTSQSSSQPSILDPSSSPTDSPAPAQAPPPPKRYKDISLDTSRTKYWLGVGAQPSEPVQRLLSLIGLMEPKPGTKTSPKS